jgi:hypothetical protein
VSEADAIFEGMDDDLFVAFGDDGTVQRGAAAAVAARVVLTRGVEKLGEYGQVVARVTTAMFRNREWVPVKGDVLVVAGVTRKVDTIDSDDGLVTVAVLHG